MGLGKIAIRSADRSPLKIYPNPAKSVIRVRCPLSVEEQTNLKIYDVSGKLVKVEKLKGSRVQEVKISLEGIKSGVYFVQVGNQTEKLIINR